MAILLFLSVVFLAYVNGANDIFKGVATLLGSRTVDYRRALGWAIGTTLAGSLTAVLFSGALVRTFTGKGLVPEGVLDPTFLVAVGVGAAATVLIATLAGIPISTTHSLTGALLGAGLAAVWTDVRFVTLGRMFFLPLLASPLLAVTVTCGLYPLLRWLRLRLRVEKETCVCLEPSQEWVPVTQVGTLAMQASGIAVRVDQQAVCAERYTGRMLGMSAQKTLDWLHFVTAGAVGFARGLNDTPKIVALLVGAQMLDLAWGALAVGLGMAAGGLLSARRVAETMSYRITEMNHGQGFTANLVTALMVLGASRIGVPVSTTHVSCGSLFGMGLVTGQARWQIVSGVLLAWVVTLPLAAGLAGVVLLVVR